MAKDIIVFDIETQKSFDEVGGRGNLNKLKISVLGAYSYEQDKYIAFEEHELDKFAEMLKNTDILIGFNSNGFDIPVLEPYININDFNLSSLDLMDDVVTGAGFRISLDNLASNTLGASKSADGLQALRWYKEGKMDEIKKYCLQDVRVTRELYEYGKKYGQILFHSKKTMKKQALPVSWGSPIQKDVPRILKEAFFNRKSVEINYDSGLVGMSDSARNIRLVDVYKIKNDSFEAYCHLRQAKRVFRIDNIISAKITKNTYKITEDVQSALF